MSETRKRQYVLEVCILAGGLSSRMGRDKSRLRLSGKSLLAHAKAAAKNAAPNCQVRVIRKDLVPRCGPLGGIYTALRTTPAQCVLFLSCDMPFVPRKLIKRLASVDLSEGRSEFVFHQGVAGFPLLISVEALPQVEALLQARRFSLQELARKLKARIIRPPPSEACLLLNVNTPADWLTACRLWRDSQGIRPAGERATCSEEARRHS